MTRYYLRLEVARMLRDPRFLALAVVAPIGFYLLFATLFGGQPAPAGQLSGNLEIMVAMAAYGAIWAVLSTTAPRIAQERGSGWLDQLRTMPIRGGQVLVAKVAASVTVALPAIVLVCLTAVLAKGVRLDPGQWVALVGSMWLGTIAFAGLGLAVGYAVDADASYVLTYGLYMVLSAMGGLWVPPAMLPGTLHDLAGWLPSYRLADLGWQVAGGHSVPWSSVAILGAWAVGLGLIGFIAYHDGVRPRRRAVVVPSVGA